MADIDEFATSLLEEAKRFLEKATDAVDDTARTAFLHAGLVLAFCALEAHLNAIGEEFSTRPELPLHAKSILLEQEVRLDEGEFRLGGLRMYRLEDRILFLHKLFSGTALDRTLPWWAHLKTAIGTRNKLTHPKDAYPITIEQVRVAIEAVMSTIDSLYQSIYKKGFPAAKLGLQSRIAF
jgi:hypothetical protein